MAGNRSPLRALRPVFLAGAATLTWLTFSAGAASAETLPDATSLLGGVTDSVSSVTDELPVSVAPPPEAAPAPDSSSGLLQPVVGEVSELTDQIVTTVPVVNQVVPEGTASAIAVPVAQFTEAATAEALEVAVPSVTELLPALDPVVQPVADLVEDTAAPPLPELPVAAPNDAQAEASPVAASALPIPDAAGSKSDQAASEAAGTGTFEAPPAPITTVDPVAVAIAYTGLQSGLFPTATSDGLPRTGDPSSAPAQAPPAPGSGTGSGTTSGGSSGSAACLSVFNLGLPLTGAVSAGETSEQFPAPVSFDPGSSPD